MATDILKAIEGFSAENAGNKRHESNIALLARVKKDIERGKDSGTSISPGKREAMQAAQKNMSAETGHSGGEGQKRSNEPAGIPARSEPVADIHADSSEERKMQAGPAPSRGQFQTVAAAPSAASGVQDIRRMAAAKELSRPDTKFPPVKRSGDGNKHSNLPGPEAASEKRIGDVRPPAKAPADKNTGEGFEGTPPFAKQSLSGDGWKGAAMRARQMWAKK